MPLIIAAAPVYAVDYLSLSEAQQQLFPGAQLSDASLNLSDDQRDAIRSAAGTRQRHKQQQIWRAQDASGERGWLLLDDVIGKHEFITYVLALSPEGSVIGMEILSYRETHGGEVRDAAWREQFQGKSTGNQITLGQDITNISGATLSCRNLTDGVRRLITLWDMYLRNV